MQRLKSAGFGLLTSAMSVQQLEITTIELGSIRSTKGDKTRSDCEFVWSNSGVERYERMSCSPKRTNTRRVKTNPIAAPPATIIRRRFLGMGTTSIGKTTLTTSHRAMSTSPMWQL